MWQRMYILFIHFLFFCFQNEFFTVNAMIGEKVRLAHAREFPTVVSIKAKNDSNPKPENNHICTGTLITKQDVLTAAHCEDDLTGYETEVVIGSIDIRQGTSHSVAWWMTYLDWTLLTEKRLIHDENDIAIVRLTRPVHESQPVSKRVSRDTYRYYGKKVLVAAFGSMVQNDISRFIHTVALTILANNRCEDRIEVIRGTRFSILEYYICAIAQPYALMSRGNSGAPIFYNKQLIGIHKGLCPNTDDPADPRKINLFLSVHYFKEFIDDAISSF